MIYRVLAYRIKDLQIPEELYVYEIPEAEIASIRARLIKEKIPHAIRRDPLRDILRVYSIKDIKFRNEPETKSLKTIPGIENQLITSAIRISLISRGWLRSVSKLYGPNTSVWSDPAEFINVYKAIKIRSDILNSEPVLFIDVARKIEFTKNVKDIENYNKDLVNRIQWVKLLDSTWSFFVIKYVVKPENLGVSKEELLKFSSKAIDSLNDIIYPRKINVSQYDFDDLILLKPYSLRLLNMLSNKGCVLRKYNGVILLPKQILKPVASTENITLFSELPLLTISPSTRVNEVKSLIRRYSLDEFELSGTSFTLDKDPIEITINEVNNFWIKIDDKYAENSNEFYIIASKWKGWQEAIPNPEDWLFIIFKYKTEYCRENNICNEVFDTVSSETEKFFKKYMETYKDNVSDLTLESPEQVIKILDSFLNVKKKYKVAILIGSPRPWVEDEIQSEFEYNVASKGFYPQYISINRLIRGIEREIEKKKRKGKKVNIKTISRSRMNYILKTILKSIIVRSGNSPMKLSFIESLKKRPIIGIDATRLRLRDFTVNIGVVVVIIDRDNNIRYEFKGYSIERSDVDALASSLSRYLKEYGESLIYINKTNVKSLLDRLLASNIDIEGSVIIGSSKTHTYSRILGYDGKSYVNPPGGRYMWIHQYKEFDQFNYSKALAIATTNTSTYGFERGTVVPVLTTIASHKDNKISHKTLMDYTINLCGYNNLSSLWIQSLPWPLHRADRLAKKLFRINKYIKTLPENNVLKYI